MDKSKFSAESPGSLEKISVQVGGNWETDWAFVPAPIPSGFSLSAELWPLLVKAKEELARLDGVGRHLPNQDLLIRPLQQREALTSSSLEGTFATAEQLLLYGMDPIDPTSETDPVNAWKEVFNYGRSLNLGRDTLDEGYPISLMLIRQLHQELLTGVRGSDQTPGMFRTRQVHIGSTRRFIPAPSLKVGQCLGELEDYLNLDSDLDPLIRSFLVHYQFETIHPFNDGNGRVGRLLLSLMIYKWCGLRSPWLYLSPFFERYKDEYIDTLFKVSSENNWSDWLSLCLHATIEQSIDSVHRIDRLVEIRNNYHEKIVNLDNSGRLHPTVDALFAEPLVRIPQLAGRHDVSYPTAKGDVDKLVQAGILKELEGTYPKAFYAPEIMNIAYHSPDESS